MVYIVETWATIFTTIVLWWLIIKAKKYIFTLPQSASVVVVVVAMFYNVRRTVVVQVSEGWDFSIEISLFVRIVIFIENLNLSYLSRGEFCVSAENLDILIPSKTAR